MANYHFADELGRMIGKKSKAVKMADGEKIPQEILLEGNLKEAARLYKEIFKKMADTLGVKAPGTALPKFVTLGYGALMGFAARIFRFSPKVSYPLALISTEEHFYDVSKVRS